MEKAREREAQGTIRQCNEGKLAFRFEETRASPMSSTAWDPYSDADLGGAEDGNMSRQHRSRGPGNIVLEVSVPRYLDSSLIDLDVHPHYVSIVIKGKVRFVCLIDLDNCILDCVASSRTRGSPANPFMSLFWLVHFSLGFVTLKLSGTPRFASMQFHQ